ncbi:MAG: 3-hydroxyacyl-CoA dehydrogenase family protein [Gracilibacteraceae bacterium]|jgi:3-hydroxybutyryl-CoA dehydrogenase|nr:3-hydroxyacyl-CoA dehydrogenase family protein [Gracilibacteraceae bacterium]
MNIHKVLVVGAGNMGHQIAIQTALNGFQVACTDVSEETLDKARAFFADWLKGRVAKQKLTQEQADGVRGRLTFTPDLKGSAADVDLVLEAVPDIVEVKKKVLREVDGYTPDRTIFGSNSSYIVSSRFADAVKDPSKVLNVHFFNPAIVMKTVEIVKGPHVSDETFATVIEFVKAIGKTAIPVHKEIYGFLVNRFVTLLVREAGYLADAEIATPENIDLAIKGALGHPMGPFELIDLAGLDLEYQVRMERFKETGDLADRPSVALISHVVKGEYGRKTGKGFYAYD